MDSLPRQYPTFSVVIETENLASSSVADFRMSICSLMQQTLSLQQANEVLLINSGDMSEAIEKELKQSYPWLKIIEPHEPMGYYQTKSYGASISTGEVVVFCDVDCDYAEDWLEQLLSSFVQKRDAHVIAGDTVIDIKGIYSTAMALNYMLHRQEHQNALLPARFYYMNNVAFQREFLLEHPIPNDIWLYRGNCAVHSRQLQQLGYTIWKQPLARAKHAPPNGFRHYVWRFLVMGHDHHWLDIHLQNPALASSASPQESVASAAAKKQPTVAQASTSVSATRPSLLTRLGRKLRYIRTQANVYGAEVPAVKHYLPGAIPLVLLSQVLILMGRIITGYSEHLLLKLYLQQFEPDVAAELFSPQSS